MHQDHPNGVWISDHPDYVSDEIKAQPVLPVGSSLKIQTANTLYTLEKRGPKEFWMQGHPVHCPEPTRVYVAGSTQGYSTLKVGFIGRGMQMEFSTGAHPGSITTSLIKEITEVREEGY